GARLFDCVFQGDVYVLYKDSLEAALLNNSQFQINFCVEGPELTKLPWEAMFDKRRLFHLLCSQQILFARGTAQKPRVLFPIHDKLPLRMICMVSAPKDFIGTRYELQTDVEQATLDRELVPLIQNRQVKHSWTASGTLRELTARIVKGDGGDKWD